MAAKVKIKIADDPALRNILDREYECSSQVELCKYALLLAEHVLQLVGYDIDDPVIKDGFSVNEKWQEGNARMHDVRLAGFKIHQKAKACKDAAVQAALRCTGQAVAAGHMKEHAMVASDYAVKVINLLYPNDCGAAGRERAWQIQQLRSVKSS